MPSRNHYCCIFKTRFEKNIFKFLKLALAEPNHEGIGGRNLIACPLISLDLAALAGVYHLRVGVAGSGVRRLLTAAPGGQGSSPAHRGVSQAGLLNG